MDVLYFPANEVKDIYKQNQMVKCFIYLYLTNTDKCSISFTFVCKKNSAIPESNANELLVQIR